MPTEEEIRKRAYELYLARGGSSTPESEHEDWVRAEQELSARAGGQGAGEPKGMNADVSDAPESGTRRNTNSNGNGETNGNGAKNGRAAQRTGATARRAR